MLRCSDPRIVPMQQDCVGGIGEFTEENNYSTNKSDPMVPTELVRPSVGDTVAKETSYRRRPNSPTTMDHHIDASRHPRMRSTCLGISFTETC